MDVTQPDGLESERARLAEAERQQRILSDVSRARLDYVGPDEDEPLRRIVANVADATGDWCTFALVQPNGVMRMAAAHHTDSRQRELAETLNKLLPPGRWDAGVPGMNALVEKRPLVFEEIPEDLLRKAVPDEEAFGILEDIGLRSAVVAPMFDAGSPLGTMTLASVGPRGRRYTQNDLDFAYALAGRAALAVRNARLVRQIAEERDHQQAARVESERRFAELRAVIDSDPNGLALFDAEGKLQLASHRLEEILEATGQALRELGYTVDEARDGVTAVTLARGARPDVMLIDLMMPVMDGWTLIARLREEQVAPGVPLVVFSADRDAREKASMLSADAALPKPFALEELQEVLDRLLRRQPAA